VPCHPSGRSVLETPPSTSRRLPRPRPLLQPTKVLERDMASSKRSRTSAFYEVASPHLDDIWAAVPLETWVHSAAPSPAGSGVMSPLRSDDGVSLAFLEGIVSNDDDEIFDMLGRTPAQPCPGRPPSETHAEDKVPVTETIPLPAPTRLSSLPPLAVAQVARLPSLPLPPCHRWPAAHALPPAASLSVGMPFTAPAVVSQPSAFRTITARPSLLPAVMLRNAASYAVPSYTLPSHATPVRVPHPPAPTAQMPPHAPTTTLITTAPTAQMPPHAPTTTLIKTAPTAQMPPHAATTTLIKTEPTAQMTPHAATTTLITTSAAVHTFERARHHGRNLAARAAWSKEEDAMIVAGVREHGCKWRLIASMLPDRSDDSVRNRWKRVRYLPVHNGGHSVEPEEHNKSHVKLPKPPSAVKWSEVDRQWIEVAPSPTRMSSTTCSTEEDKPAERVSWSAAEDCTIMRSVEELGHKWQKISARLPGRTDHAIRNRYARLQSLTSRGQPMVESSGHGHPIGIQLIPRQDAADGRPQAE